MDKRANRNTECECCGYPAETILEFPKRTSKDKIKLCQICSSTHISQFAQYPELFEDAHIKIAKSIGWGINYIKDIVQNNVPREIREFK